MIENGIDVLISLEGIRSPLLNRIFEIVTALGEHTVLVVVLAVIYFTVDKELAKRIMFITMSSLCINGVVKNFVKLPRPFASGKVSCVRPGTATGYSFPSGHTQSFSTWSSALALKYRYVWMAMLSVLGTLAVAFSRMYLGAHYPGDVAAGAVLGFTMSIVFSLACDKIKDKHVLYTAVILAMTPFALFFLFEADVHFADFYKIYGMLSGLLCASLFEEKYVQLDIHTTAVKKVVRVVLGILLALALKEGLKLIFDSDSARLMLVLASVRYFILIVVVMGLYTLAIKKLKL